MSNVLAERGAIIGHYTEGDWESLPGEAHVQQKIGGDYRLALRSLIRGTLARRGRGVRFVEGDEGNFAVRAEPPFESAEQAAEAAGEIDASWQKQLARSRGGEAVLTHLDIFTPITG